MSQETAQAVVQAAKAEVTGQPTQAPANTAAPQAPVETQAPEAVKPEVKEQPPEFAEQFARLAKKERMMREQQSRQEARIREYEQRLAEFDSLDKDPLALLEKRGWNIDKLLERAATGETPKPTTDDKVSELQKKLDALEKAKQEAEEQAKSHAERRAIAEYKAQIKQVVDTSSDQYEAIKELAAYDMVFVTAEEIFQESGEVPDIAKVAEAVEKHLVMQLEKAFKLKKFGDRLQPKADQPVETAKAQEIKPSANTLTAQTTGVTKPPQGKLVPREQSLAEAAKNIRWT